MPDRPAVPAQAPGADPVYDTLTALDLAVIVRRAYPRMAEREGLSALDELVRRADRYQTDDFPHNKVKPPRDGNHRGRDTTEVTVMPTQSNDTNDADSVYDRICRVMSDAQLEQAIEDIRGNPKRGRQRSLRLGEIAALTALYREHERRHGVSNGF